MFRLVVVFALMGTLANAMPQVLLHPDTHLNVLEIIEKHGYPVERHSLTTEDGYVLEMQRIPYGKNNAGQKNKPAVLLMHGLMSSAADWTNAGPDNSIAFLLADLGYDVWLGNARGTTWSRKHVTLDPDADKEKFWDFSFDEIGRYDLPAKIDYILAKSGEEQLFYIGHSQGTTTFLIMGSERPEYNSKIRLSSLLGPAILMSNLKNPFVPFLASKEQDLDWITKNIGLYEFLPSSDLIENLAAAFCDDGSKVQSLCADILFLIAGFDRPQFNNTLLPVIATNAPAGSATKQLIHYAQEYNSGLFQRFDYHSEELNTAKYGQAVPPEYDFSKITAPLAIHYGQNDWLVAVEDAQTVISKLPNVVLDNKIKFRRFNHIDFLWAIDVVDLLYNDIFAEMEKH